MEIKAVLFDLDGTLLPMDQDEFVKTYFGLLAKRLASRGYEPQKLIETVVAGTMAMMKNDGSSSNEAVFWKVFTDTYGEEALKDKEYIDAFYAGEFSGAKVCCGFAKESREVIDLVKAKGRILVLATNPLFPSIATENRMRWAGLKPEDFVLYTTYEDSYHCKPNPQYYLDILEKIGCRPEECLMVGNDVTEDMVAETLGMKVFLLTDCLINKKDADISCYLHGGFEELKRYLEML